PVHEWPPVRGITGFDRPARRERPERGARLRRPWPPCRRANGPTDRGHPGSVPPSLLIRHRWSVAGSAARVLVPRAGGLAESTGVAGGAPELVLPTNPRAGAHSHPTKHRGVRPASPISEEGESARVPSMREPSQPGRFT